MKNFSVLFVRKDSIYKNLGCNCYDIERNALIWPGGHPIIAHPPCRAWGKLKGLAKPKPGERELAIWSVEQIRKYGGVLEHPKHSTLWKEMNLPTGKNIDEFGGFSLSIDQFWFGHKAQKSTHLYIVGIKPGLIPAMPLRFDAVEYVISTSKRNAKGHRSKAKKETSKKDREATPPELAKWLIEIATIISNEKRQ